jgi:hypothetical protein
MTIRRLLLFLLAAAFFAGLAPASRADDAQTIAAMAAIGQAGGAAGGAAGAAAAGGAQGHKKKDESGFSRPLTAPQFSKNSDGDQDRPTASKKKKTDVKTKPSKYKSRDLDEHGEHVYRFNSDGEPLNSAPKKKDAAKPKKKASTESDDAAEKAGDCSSDEPCAAKKSDGDAF